MIALTCVYLFLTKDFSAIGDSCFTPLLRMTFRERESKAPHRLEKQNAE